MSQFPVLKLSTQERASLQNEIEQLRRQTTVVSKEIDSCRRKLKYCEGYEIDDAHLIAIYQGTMATLHAQMQARDEIKTTAELASQQDVRALVGAPTRRRCACCDASIYNQYSKCPQNVHCVCPLCFADSRFQSDVVECFQCLRAPNDVPKCYVLESTKRGF